MASRISIFMVAVLAGMSISLTADAFSLGSGSSNQGPGQRGMRAGPGFNRRSAGGFRIEKRMDEKGYYLTIHAGGMAPEDILITPMQGSLVINSSRSSQSETRDQDPGRSYRFSRSFGGFTRRISIPFDADTENMERSDSDGVVTLFMPRRADMGGQGFGQDPAPGQYQGPGFNQAPGSAFPPPTGFNEQAMPPSDQSQYPIPDQPPPTGDIPPTGYGGPGQGPGYESGQIPAPGIDQDSGRGYPQQPGFAQPYGYGAYDPYRAPYGQPIQPPGQMPFPGQMMPAAPGGSGACSCPCPCPEKRVLPKSE